MPIIGFICPDDIKVSLDQCLNNKCRLESSMPAGRCKALPFLRKCAQQREWTGTPSTTQLLNGPREAWLKITRPYYVNPDSRAFMLHGSSVHAKLEALTEGDHYSEERITDAINSGAFDFYDGTLQTLFDYKAFGSYKIMQMLGIGSIEVPSMDSSGNIEYFKSGPRKGQVKMRKEYVYGDVAIRAIGCLDVSIQLSDYRDKLRTILPKGYDVRRMAVQCIARDSNTIMQQMRKIGENAPLIPINGISSHWIKRYFKRKRELLLAALERNYAPLCRRRERWFERKCAGYCEVAEACQATGGWNTDPHMNKLLMNPQESQPESTDEITLCNTANAGTTN